jgi:hypothetical protein
MTHPVTLENEHLKVEVWPQYGGKVASIVDKADRFELLFNYPAELPERSQYDLSYGKGWYAGWDECFPAVAPSQYSGHPYNGIAVPDHGEVWGLPAMATPTREGITTLWHGLRFGYRLSRNLHLEGASIVADYTVENLAPFDFHFVWAQHALMDLSQGVELELPAGGMRSSHDAEGRVQDRAFEWPVLEQGQDLSRPGGLPGGRGWKVFSREPVSGTARVRYPSRGRGVRMAFSSEDVKAYWGVWINTGGWAGHRHFAVEPTTGRFDQLDRSIADGSAGCVGAAGECSWGVRWTVEGSITPS